MSIELDGKKIRIMRLTKELNQENVANEIGVDQQYISRIERNKHKRISLCTAFKISEFFGCTIDELLKK